MLLVPRLTVEMIVTLLSYHRYSIQLKHHNQSRVSRNHECFKNVSFGINQNGLGQVKEEVGLAQGQELDKRDVKLDRFYSQQICWAKQKIETREMLKSSDSWIRLLKRLFTLKVWWIFNMLKTYSQLKKLKCSVKNVCFPIIKSWVLCDTRNFRQH